MSTLLRSLVVSALLAGGAAFAQVHVDVGLPSIHFAVQPPLVVVSTGVQVVPDQEEEVFYSGGYYWTRRDNRWYRCRHDWRWRLVEARYVPVGVARLPPGHYRHWKRVRRERREERRELRHEYRREERHERHHDRGHGHGRGHDRR
jgi:hypothetical protein